MGFPSSSKGQGKLPPRCPAAEGLGPRAQETCLGAGVTSWPLHFVKRHPKLTGLEKATLPISHFRHFWTGIQEARKLEEKGSVRFDLCLRASQILGRDCLTKGGCKVGFLTAQLQGHERCSEDSSLRAGDSGSGEHGS